METVMMLRVERPEELICADCGAAFPSHGAGDGLEQLCNGCYTGQFKPQCPMGHPVHKEWYARTHREAA